MSILSAVAKFFSGGETMNAIEKIATEYIETNLEKAESNALMIKTLDPNGAMRRQLSADVTKLYKLYIVSALAMLFIEFFVNLVGMNTDLVIGESLVAISMTTDKIVELFLPITSLFGVIVTASFGVNYANINKEKK